MPARHTLHFNDSIVSSRATTKSNVLPNRACCPAPTDHNPKDPRVESHQHTTPARHTHGRTTIKLTSPSCMKERDPNQTGENAQARGGWGRAARRDPVLGE